MAQKPASKRFVPYSKDDLKELTAQADFKSTKRVVDRSRTLFHEFLKNSAIEMEINEMSAEFLNGQVELFLASVRKLDGEDMKKKTLDSVKYGLSKYLLQEYNIDLTKSEFSGSKNIYKAKVKQLKKTGKGSVEHKPLIDISDLEKLTETDCVPFNISTPCGLQNRVWFMLMWYLVRRGQENLRTMTKSTFGIGVNGAGRRYVEQIEDEADKNHGGDVNPDETIGEGKMYEWENDDPYCPVKLFETYVSKLNPKCDTLWQRPLESFNPIDSTWYCNAPVGKNGLANFMPKISKQGKLSKVYTNHCLRATAIKYLDEAGVEARHIKRVSGHMSIASIESYAQRLSENKKEEISDALTGPFVSKSVKTATVTVTSSATSDLDSVDASLLNDENDFQEMIAPPSLAQPSLAQPSVAQPSVTQPFVAQPLVAQPISTCTMNDYVPVVNNSVSGCVSILREQNFRNSAPIFNISNCVVNFSQGYC